jgi:HK97 family phage prohead protease
MSEKTGVYEIKLLASEQAAAGGFSGYASTFGNRDAYDDIVEKGAFAGFLKKLAAGDKVPVLWQHMSDKPIGYIKTAREDDQGLYLEAAFASTAQAQEARKLAEEGIVSKMSIGYLVTESDYDKSGVRRLKAVDLKEVSLVTFPANEKAVVTSVKAGLPKTEREFEKHLKSIGFSANDAKRITIYGFKPREEAKAERDAQNLKELLNIATKLRELSNDRRDKTNN